MSSSSVSTTRSLAIGLLLAVVSAGSLVVFSYVAGSADDPRAASVRASSPAARVTPMVLGTRISQTKPGRERTRPERVRPGAPPQEPSQTIVLGTRVENPNPPSGSPPGDGTDGGSKFGSIEKVSKPEVAKKPAQSCECDAKSKDHSPPNGNAYGYHKNHAGGGSAPAAPKSDSKSHASPGAAHSEDHGADPGNNGNGHAYGRGHGSGKPKKK